MLARLFPLGGDPGIGFDVLNGCYIESAAISPDNVSPVWGSADELLNRANGLASIHYSGFRRAELVGRFTDPAGTVSVVALADTVRARVEFVAAGVVGQGVDPVSPATPPAQRALRLADNDPEVARALRLLGKANLTWSDLYLLYEILNRQVGRDAIVAREWASRNDLDRLKASADQPSLGGPDARHAYDQGTPSPKRRMPVETARALTRQLVQLWIENHPAY